MTYESKEKIESAKNITAIIFTVCKQFLTYKTKLKILKILKCLMGQ